MDWSLGFLQSVYRILIHRVYYQVDEAILYATVASFFCTITEPEVSTYEYDDGHEMRKNVFKLK